MKWAEMICLIGRLTTFMVHPSFFLSTVHEKSMATNVAISYETVNRKSIGLAHKHSTSIRVLSHACARRHHLHASISFEP